MVTSCFDKYHFSHFSNQQHHGLRGHGSPGWPYCDFCNNLGHKRDTCYKLQGYPNQHGGTKSFAPSVNHATDNESPLGPSMVPQLMLE